MTREEILERLLGNLELAAANLKRKPRDEGARNQLGDVLTAVGDFRRMDAAQAAFARHPAPVTDTALLTDERREPADAPAPVASPVMEAERTGRCGYIDKDID